MLRNREFFQLSTDCITAVRSPGVEDKTIPVGTLFSVDSDDSYVFPSMCYGTEDKTWDTFALVNGTSLPSSVTFDPATSTLSGSITTPGTYTIEMKRTSVAIP